MDVFYSDAYVLAGYSFETTRKARWVADSLVEQPIPGVMLVEPEPLTAEQVCEVHDPAYVEAVRTGEPRWLAESQGFSWDPGLFPMVLASNGGAVAAALVALDSGRNAGSLSSGLHHARRDRGSGFCTFNGLALAARTALRSGARSILIVDLDAHSGGGTHSLLGDEPAVHQLDVAVSPFDRYRASPRTTLDLVVDPDEYLPTLSRRLDALERSDTRFELCLYNAGMDPFGDCPIGGLEGMTEELLRDRERMVFSWCASEGIPVAFVLAGGYIGSEAGREDLVRLHRATIESAAKHEARGPDA